MSRPLYKEPPRCARDDVMIITRFARDPSDFSHGATRRFSPANRRSRPKRHTLFPNRFQKFLPSSSSSSSEFLIFCYTRSRRHVRTRLTASGDSDDRPVAHSRCMLTPASHPFQRSPSLACVTQILPFRSIFRF